MVSDIRIYVSVFRLCSYSHYIEIALSSIAFHDAMRNAKDLKDQMCLKAHALYMLLTVRITTSIS